MRAASCTPVQPASRHRSRTPQPPAQSLQRASTTAAGLTRRHERSSSSMRCLVGPSLFSPDYVTVYSAISTNVTVCSISTHREQPIGERNRCVQLTDVVSVAIGTHQRYWRGRCRWGGKEADPCFRRAKLPPPTPLPHPSPLPPPPPTPPP